MKTNIRWLLGLLFLCIVATAYAAEGEAVETVTMDEGMKWEYIIAIVAPFIVAGIKWAVPKVPKLALPAVTPVVGLALGFALNALADANLGAEQMAQAGAMAVFVREITDQALKAAGFREEDSPRPTTQITP